MGNVLSRTMAESSPDPVEPAAPRDPLAMRTPTLVELHKTQELRDFVCRLVGRGEGAWPSWIKINPEGVESWCIYNAERKYKSVGWPVVYGFRIQINNVGCYTADVHAVNRHPDGHYIDTTPVEGEEYALFLPSGLAMTDAQQKLISKEVRQHNSGKAKTLEPRMGGVIGTDGSETGRGYCDFLMRNQAPLRVESTSNLDVYMSRPDYIGMDASKSDLFLLDRDGRLKRQQIH